jgi:DNA polymerase elongation subunit (family B)
MTTRKRLFYDIETSFCQGHFWRPGYNQNILPHQITDYAKIISIHWKWEGENKVKNLNWGLNDQCDKKMLKAFIKEMNKADEIITHNGKRFDTPWIRTRCLFHGIPMRPQYKEIDTYKLCKKYLNLPSNSLKEVCKYYALPAKKDAGGIQTWIDVIYKKDKKAMKHMLYYGDGDIISLEAVFKKLNPYVAASTQYAVLSGYDKFCCPECGSMSTHNKRYTTTAGTVQHYMRCNDYPDWGKTFRINNKTYQDWLNHKMINGIK